MRLPLPTDVAACLFPLNSTCESAPLSLQIHLLPQRCQQACEGRNLTHLIEPALEFAGKSASRAGSRKAAITGSDGAGFMAAAGPIKGSFDLCEQQVVETGTGSGFVGGGCSSVDRRRRSFADALRLPRVIPSQGSFDERIAATNVPVDGLSICTRRGNLRIRP